MARIADKHGLTNKYREPGMKRVVKRGRPRKYITSSRRHYKSNRKATRTPAATTANDVKLGCATTTILILLLSLLIVGISSCNSNSHNDNKKYVDYNFLIQPGHPVLYDEYDAVVEFYKGYENTSIGSYQSHKKVEKPVITALSYLSYDRIYLITLNLNNLEQKFSFNEAIDIALDYIPIDFILENFVFEKAIYKTKEDGKTQFECYYALKDDLETPGYYYEGDNWIKLQSGFSLVIEETVDDTYIVRIGDDRYDFVYSAMTIGWEETMKAERATHKDWDFTIEGYLSTQ